MREIIVKKARDKAIKRSADSLVSRPANEVSGFSRFKDKVML